jgi:CRISPR-associated protein Cmr5
MIPKSHRLAKCAYARIELRLKFPHEKAFGTLALKLPAMILQNGLAQATGFLIAKGNEEHQAVLDDLAATMHAANGCTATTGTALHQEVINADTAATMRLTRSALEASGWIKRYVQGVLKINATGEERKND